MNHTPKPWVLDEHVTSDSEGEICIVVFCPDGPGYGRVAQVYAECGRNTELKPNGRLIAAAPELLEALESLLDEYERIFWRGHETVGYIAKTDPPNTYTRAREVIAKAKGE